MSANLAYGEAMVGSIVKGALFEEPDRVVQSDLQPEGHYEVTEQPDTTNNPPPAPVYDTVEGRKAD